MPPALQRLGRQNTIPSGSAAASQLISCSQSLMHAVGMLLWMGALGDMVALIMQPMESKKHAACRHKQM